ncbi:MAG TPA: L-arabinose ABC transporter ATP-binding protein AraG [Steroidobacteraceae bacterium]|nr:L-arabinose ABC transporter ATP-binding protein AraG [Steroidobacteraceae bacterium]
MTSSSSALELANVTVNFGPVRALSDVSLEVRAGEVHGLMGENGAGKSTLLKVLAGALQPQQGRIKIHGVEQKFSNTREAIQAGVSIIYQELHLVPQLTVAENLMLGQMPTRSGVLSRKEMLRRAQAELDRLGEPIDPNARVATLSMGQRQMIEIGKALMRDARVIAFDEPTSSLSVRETERLVEIIRKLRSEGRAIIYVTHRMDEVDELCDRVTVFRDGHRICVMDKAAAINRDELVAAMIGRRVEDVYGYRSRELGPVQLEVQNVMGPGLREPVSISAKRGEIVGMFGLVGAGRTELLKIICGAQRATQGSIIVNGTTLRMRSPGDGIAAGIALAPEDRQQEGLVPAASVSENINLSCRRNHARYGFIRDLKRERGLARDYIGRLSIKTPDEACAVKNLSGGNQQKVILSRYLADRIDVFLLDEPTRGIDVGARKQIYDLLYELASSGKTLIVVSSDLAEVTGICDRILVMRTGRLVGDLNRNEATADRLVRLALPN